MGKDPPAYAGDARDVGLIPGSGRSLEEEMATHSSVLAWRIPWAEEPGGLQSMGSQKVRHSWEHTHSSQSIFGSTHTHTHTHTHGNPQYNSCPDRCLWGKPKGHFLDVPYWNYGHEHSQPATLSS